MYIMKTILLLLLDISTLSILRLLSKNINSPLSFESKASKLSLILYFRDLANYNQAIINFHISHDRIRLVKIFYLVLLRYN